MKIYVSVVAIFISFSGLLAQSFDDLLKKGDEYFDASNYGEAVKYFTMAIERDSKNVKGFWYRADAYREMDKYEEAISDYSKAMIFEPDNITFFTRRGDCYYNLNQFETALKDYAAGIELNNTNATLWLYAGDCYAKLNKRESACTYYQKANDLGDKTAKGQAKEISCDWIKSVLPKPCPTAESLFTKVRVEQFTGATIVARGMSYSGFEIKTEAEGSTITGPEFGMGESFVFKIAYPTGFCLNEDDELYPGTGFSLLDAEGKELGAAQNIYKTDESIPQEYLKSLSITLDFREPMESGKKYILKIRFFDAKGNSEVLINLPFLLSKKTHTSSETYTTESSLGPGITSASVGLEVKSLDCHEAGKLESIKDFELIKNNLYNIDLTTSNPPSTNSNLTIRIIDVETGVVVSELTSKAVTTGMKTKVEISTQNLNKSFYLLWIRLSDPNNNESLNVQLPILVK